MSERGTPRRSTVTIDQLWVMAGTWYASRLTLESRRPAAAEIRGIFSGILGSRKVSDIIHLLAVRHQLCT